MKKVLLFLVFCPLSFSYAGDKLVDFHAVIEGPEALDNFTKGNNYITGQNSVRGLPENLDVKLMGLGENVLLKHVNRFLQDESIPTALGSGYMLKKIEIKIIATEYQPAASAFLPESNVHEQVTINATIVHKSTGTQKTYPVVEKMDYTGLGMGGVYLAVRSTNEHRSEVSCNIGQPLSFNLCVLDMACNGIDEIYNEACRASASAEFLQ